MLRHIHTLRNEQRRIVVVCLGCQTGHCTKYEIDESVVNLVRDDTAIIAYKVTEQLTVDGEPVTLKAADASTWVRRDGRWLCALHTESVIGDPFGRHRRPG